MDEENEEIIEEHIGDGVPVPVLIQPWRNYGR